jgi:penicillin-binding protein 2
MSTVKELVKNHTAEKALFQRRLWVAASIIVLLILTLIGRLLFLQILEHKRYTTLSNANQFTLLPIAPPRGLIYDRHGVLLAANNPVFNLALTPNKVKNISATIVDLQTVLTISNDDLAYFYKQLKQNGRFNPIILKAKLSADEMARFYVNQYRFSGVHIDAELVRYYPQGDNFVSALGYVGRINLDELKKVNPQNYLGTNYIGKLGIEKFYENELHGTVGYQQVETDANGQIVRVLQRKPPISGHDLHLSLDSTLQIAAANALNGERGAVVAIEPKTGRVLALVSAPGYDPNPFVFGISANDYTQLRDSPDHPLYNRSIRGQYPLASTIKPFSAIAALYYNAVTPDWTIPDPGYYTLPNGSHTYRDWKRGGHGLVSLGKAITVSCDTYFYQVAGILGITRLGNMLKTFGYGEKTGLDVGEELPGLVPTPEWKLKTKGQPWYLGDTIVAGIGQGYLLTTPLQMAHAVAGIATRGQLYRPSMVDYQILANGDKMMMQSVALPPIQLSADNWNLIIAAMQNVVLSGTARYSFGIPPYTIAAKTGTGQVFSTFGRGTDKSKAMPKHLQDNSSFIAFAPIDNPKIALAVVIENGNHAAPAITRQIMDAFFNEAENAIPPSPTP